MQLNLVPYCTGILSYIHSFGKDKQIKLFAFSSFRGYSIVVICILPKDERRVRFPLPASCADVAQLAEQRYRKPWVVGANPTIGFDLYMIYFKNVSKIYPPNSPAVKDIHLQIEQGEFVSIVGQSGTGKTTLVKLMIAEEKPSLGELTINGWDVGKLSAQEIPILRRQMGVIFQDFKLLDKKTVFENVAFALQVCGTPSSRINKVVPEVLEIVGLDKKSQRYPGQLSGGEQQRVVVARSLVHAPKIIVADEPTGNLDALNTQEVIEILKRINDLGVTVVLVTHNREIVNMLRRRVITLDQGKIVNDQAKGKYII